MPWFPTSASDITDPQNQMQLGLAPIGCFER
jgi:hypothetical protein